ncbi:MFS transporter [Actinomadura sp. J1-007]|nr:MFS transporter [Actinomadura sp. J1-007]
MERVVVAPARTGGAVLGLLAASQFLVALNTSIVNVALPAIGDDLALSPAGLSWVVNAYLVAFGALLLVGGRIADVHGRRRTLLAGSGCSPRARSPRPSPPGRAC